MQREVGIGIRIDRSLGRNGYRGWDRTKTDVC
jgi:hypothetical protein